MPKEKALIEAWQHPRLRQLKLSTTTGQELRVVYPGSYSAQGPDFRGAVLLLEGQRVQGDVEVDLEGSLWQSHGHHQDPAFNQVVLQVVYGEPGPTPRQRGKGVEVLSLGAFLTWEDMAGWGKGFCKEVGTEEVEAWGEARFRAKAEAFSREIARQGAEQALFEGLLLALGYAKNQGPMAALARSLPWPALAPRMRARDPAQAQAWLWSLFQKRAEGLSWQLGGLRPQNHPWRRLEAGSHLLARYGPEIVSGLGGLISGVKALERGLMVPRLLGRGRAAEIAVNILLPFFWAWGEDRAWRLFKAYPKLEENQVTRLMRRRLRLRSKITSACAQQGLIHCYKTYCEPGRCKECLAQLEVRGDIQVPTTALAQS